MPLYEYQCDKCGDIFEVMQKFADTPLTTHEKCGGGAVHRLISAPALQFKGSGWYVNDYAKTANPSGGGNGAEKKTGTEKKADTPAPASSSSDSSSASSSTGDSKPASSSDTK